MSEEKGPRRETSSRRTRGVKRGILLVLCIAGAAILAHAAFWGSYVDAHVYTVEELSDGPRWQIIPWDEGRRTAVQVSFLSAHPADRVWRVVSDQGRFDEFMPFVEKNELRPGTDGSFILEQALDLPVGRYDLALEIRNETRNGARAATWRQTRGDLSFNQGAWVVEDHGGDAVIRYQVSASLDWVPQWAVNFAMGRRLKVVLSAVEARVKHLGEREPDYFRP